MPPQYLLRHTPLYPAPARAQRFEGVVLLLVAVDADGRVTNASVRQSCGHLVLDRAALEVSAVVALPPRVAGRSRRPGDGRSPDSLYILGTGRELTRWRREAGWWAKATRSTGRSARSSGAAMAKAGVRGAAIFSPDERELGGRDVIIGARGEFRGHTVAAIALIEIAGTRGVFVVRRVFPS